MARDTSGRPGPDPAAWLTALSAACGASFKAALTLSLAATLGAGLTACATTADHPAAGHEYRDALYQWGSYPTQPSPTPLAADPSPTTRQALEAHITRMEQSRQKVAPGLYAELGTLYLQAGEPARAVGYFGRERDAWPESRPLMDALIARISMSHHPRPRSPS